MCVGGGESDLKASQCLKLDSKVLSLVPAPVPITQWDSQGSVMGGGGGGGARPVWTGPAVGSGARGGRGALGGAGELPGSWERLQMHASEGSVSMVSKGV